MDLRVQCFSLHSLPVLIRPCVSDKETERQPLRDHTEDLQRSGICSSDVHTLGPGLSPSPPCPLWAAPKPRGCQEFPSTSLPPGHPEVLPESCAPLQTLQTPQACACTRGPACHPRFLPPRLPLSLSFHSRCDELSSSCGLIGTVSQPPGSHPKPLSIQWPCFELLPLPLSLCVPPPQLLPAQPLPSMG